MSINVAAFMVRSPKIPKLTWPITRRATYDDWIKLRPGFDQRTKWLRLPIIGNERQIWTAGAWLLWFRVCRNTSWACAEWGLELSCFPGKSCSWWQFMSLFNPTICLHVIRVRVELMYSFLLV